MARIGSGGKTAKTVGVVRRTIARRVEGSLTLLARIVDLTEPVAAIEIAEALELWV